MGRFKLINVFRSEKEPKAMFGIDTIDRVSNYDSKMAEAVINSYPVCRTLPED
jgi:hypothetical protein